jgi:hypothetical protein
MNFKLEDISFKITEVEDEWKWKKTIFLIYFNAKIEINN